MARCVLRAEDGQATLLLLGALLGVLVIAVIFGAVAKGAGQHGDLQRAADLAALAGARAMHREYSRLFEPAVVDGQPNPRHIERSNYLRQGEIVAKRIARANGAATVGVTFPDQRSFAPVRVRVEVSARFGVRVVVLRASAEAELAPPTEDDLPTLALGGGYDGPLAYRQGKPMRPDVAAAFDRMERAAQADGIALLINSAFRSDAQQAALWARHPDPRWVARPGKSLHRQGTELDLGPANAHSWLAAHAATFHFIRRYSWEPWHFGYSLNARSTPRGPVPKMVASAWPTSSNRMGGTGRSHKSRSVPDFVPSAFAPFIIVAAQRWNVSATLLSAQIYAESNFNPFAISSAGAQGIAQFMPATARSLGLANPFDAKRSIDAQAHLMRDLLRQFASVPLALAAYNAGAGAVARCNCIPPFKETRSYVAKILGLMSGAGEPLAADGSAGLLVRLIR